MSSDDTAVSDLTTQASLSKTTVRPVSPKNLALSRSSCMDWVGGAREQANDSGRPIKWHLSTHIIEHGLREVSMADPCSFPVIGKRLVPPPGDDLVIEDLHVPAWLVGDLLHEIEHASLPRCQRNRKPGQHRVWEPRHVWHVVHAQAEARQPHAASLAGLVECKRFELGT